MNVKRIPLASMFERMSLHTNVAASRQHKVSQTIPVLEAPKPDALLTAKMTLEVKEKLVFSEEDKIRGPDERHSVEKHLPHAVWELCGPLLVQFAPYRDFLFCKR